MSIANVILLLVWMFLDLVATEIEENMLSSARRVKELYSNELFMKQLPFRLSECRRMESKPSDCDDFIYLSEIVDMEKKLISVNGINHDEQIISKPVRDINKSSRYHTIFEDLIAENIPFKGEFEAPHSPSIIDFGTCVKGITENLITHDFSLSKCEHQLNSMIVPSIAMNNYMFRVNSTKVGYFLHNEDELNYLAHWPSGNLCPS